MLFHKISVENSLREQEWKPFLELCELSDTLANYCRAVRPN